MSESNLALRFKKLVSEISFSKRGLEEFSNRVLLDSGCALVV